eukprot:1001887-Amphidinium_carterae.1
MATEQQVRKLVEELQRMSARVVVAEQTTSAAATQAAAAQRQQVAQGGHATRLVDTRALGKPREFKSVREDWKDWSFQFKTFLCGANPDAGVWCSDDKASERGVTQWFGILATTCP